MNQKRKKIAIAINLELPLVRYYEYFRGIGDYAKKYTDWFLINDHFPEKGLEESKNEPYYDGVIGRITPEIYDITKELNIPVVTIWRAGGIDEIPAVYPDYKLAGKRVAKYLLERGFSNFISTEMDEIGPMLFREGVEEGISKRKFKMRKYQVDYEYSVDGNAWYQFRKDIKAMAIAENYPVAICCSNSSIAAKIMALCMEYELKVPEQIALITTGNEEAHYSTTKPYISNMKYDFYMDGYMAAKMLDEQLKGLKPSPHEYLTDPGEIFTRDSTDIYASQEKEVKEALQYINDNIAEDFQVNDIANEVGLNRRALEYKFEKSLGVSVSETINQIRIEMSKRLLTQSNESIVNIQTKVGFTTPLQMRRTFHKYTKQTPGQYRKLFKNKG